ncbi:MAG: sigma-54 dependent transcriptional regulator [Ignavibacteria bacterium]|nr:sigma-54 dependent transcriptional regulator [Ignavibacteria bacterium]
MSEHIKVLVVDDEENSTNLIRKVLLKKGLNVTGENNSVAAKKLIEENFYDIVISDLQMPDLSGMDLLKIKPKDTLFIMITGYGSVASAVESMKNGAYDYVNKPFNLEEFILKVDKAIEKISLTKELSNLKKMVPDKEPYFGIIGSSKKMIDVYDFIERTAKINVNVLIQGQSGTGKELVARALHINSERKDKPFIAINCSAIPENLLESELFGHTKGAFTGATETQKGVFEQANGGSLFLDEIAEMPYTLQAKLLRVIETWEVKPLGSDNVKKVNVRLISATNQNIREMISAKAFREDLFYRISTVSVTLPPLNERMSDIPALTNFILNLLSGKLGKTLSISPDALKLLMNHNYKGNIRELENILEQAAITAPNGSIEPKHISTNGEKNYFEEYLSNSSGISLKELEKKYILKMLEISNGNKKKTAELLGIDRKTLYNKLSEFGMDL